jgi:hypothetical protein
MQRAGFANNAQIEILRCTKRLLCPQLSDAPIRAQIRAFLERTGPNSEMPGMSITSTHNYHSIT